MLIESPFHARTAALCTSFRWNGRADYHAAVSFEVAAKAMLAKGAP